MRLATRIALAVFTATASGVAQDSWEVAGWNIVRRYGAQGSISAVQFQEFVLEELLDRADGNDRWPAGPPTLNKQEYGAAWLDRLLAPGGYAAGSGKTWPNVEVGLKTMPAGNTVWHSISTHVLATQMAHLSRVKSSGPYNANDIDAYLKLRKPLPRTDADRLELLQYCSAGAADITPVQYQKYHLYDFLIGLDVDGSGFLDAWEFRRGCIPIRSLSDAHAHAIFIALANASDLIDIKLSGLAGLFAKPTSKDPRAPLVQWANTEGLKYWDEKVKWSGSINVRRVLDLIKPATASRITTAGYLIHPGPVRANNTSTYDPSKSNWFVQVRKDMRTRGLAAEPATFRYEEVSADGAPGVDTLGIDGSLVLVYKQPLEGNWYSEFLLGTRWRRSRVKGPAPVDGDLREYFVGWMAMTIDDRWIFNGQRFRFGLLRQEDQPNDVTRNSAIVEWFPQIGGGSSLSGSWNSIIDNKDADPVLEFYYLPNIGIDLGDYEDNRAMSAEQSSTLRVEASIGLRLYGDLTLQGRFRSYTDLEDFGSSYGAQETTLSYPIGSSKAVTITGSYRSGRELPTFNREEVWSIGFGVKF